MNSITETTKMLFSMVPRPLMPSEINELSLELGEHIFKTKVHLINKDNPDSGTVIIYFDYSANMFVFGDVDNKLQTYISHVIIRILVRCGII